MDLNFVFIVLKCQTVQDRFLDTQKLLNKIKEKLQKEK